MDKKIVAMLATSFLILAGGTLHDHYMGGENYFGYSGDIDVWQERFQPIPFWIIIVTEAAILCFCLPLITSKTYEAIYGKPMDGKKWSVYLFLFFVSPFALMLSYGFYGQLNATFFAAIVLYYGVKRDWLWVGLYAVPLILCHSMGVLLLGLTLATITIKEKKYWILLLCIVLTAALSASHILPRRTYGFHMLSPSEHKGMEWNDVSTPLVYYGVSILTLSSGHYDRLSIMVVILTIILLWRWRSQRPQYLNCLLAVFLAVTLASHFANNELIRAVYTFYAFFPLFIGEKNI